MKFGNAAWGFRKTPLERQLAVTREMGLSLLELSIAGHPNDVLQLGAGPEEIDRVGELFAACGVSPACIAHGNDFTLPDPAEDRRQLENVKQVVAIARRLGGRHLRIFAGFSPVGEVTGTRWRTMIDCLKAAVDCAGEAGIVPVVETHGGVTALPDGVRHFPSTTTRPETLEEILDAVLGLSVNFDPTNLYAVGFRRPEDFYRRFRKRIPYIHLKDFVPAPGSDALLPAACGESAMDWDARLTELTGFTGPALIEYENTADVADGCRRSLRFLRKKLAQPSEGIPTA